MTNNHHIADGHSLDELSQDIASIIQAMQTARKELASLRTGNEKRDILTATEELEGIVTGTESATNSIIAAAESIGDIISDESIGFDEKESKILEAQTDIMLSCSFQDLTAQRIKRVVKALLFIEDKISKMAEIVGVTDEDIMLASMEEEINLTDDDKLLNGPARDPGESVNQNDIDALFD